MDELTKTPKEKTLRDILINKKITVKPIKREGSWLPPGHDGEFMFTDTIFSVDLPVNNKTNQRIAILTKEEQSLFEKELNLKEGDMSFYNKDKGYWAGKDGRVKLTKEGIELDLNEPTDFLKYKILLANKRLIAPSWKDRFQSGEYKFAIVEEDEETKTNISKMSVMKEVYRYVGKIEDSYKKMQDVLRLYGKKTSNNDIEFLKGEIQKLIDKDANEFVKIMSDPKFNTKIFIEDALVIRAFERNEHKAYLLKGGDMIGRTLQEAIEWVENPNNQDIVIRIKAQIQNK